MSSIIAPFPSFVGLFVGWLFVTYGLVLWGAETRDAKLSHAFAFVTTGAAILLVANDALIPPVGGLSAFLGTIGYIILAVLGTTVFVNELYELSVDLDVETDGGWSVERERERRRESGDERERRRE